MPEEILHDKKQLHDKIKQGLKQTIVPANLQRRGPLRLSKVLLQLNKF
jgi:hypothetical protein